MGLFKKGRYWYYEFIIDGKRYRKSTGEEKKTRARDVERARREELSDKRSGRRTTKDITFGELTEKFLETHAAGKRGYGFFEATTNVLRRHFGDHKLLSEIGPHEVDAFMAARRSEVAASTANRSLAILKQMLKLAIRWGHAEANPAADLRKAKEPASRENYLTFAQRDRLLEALGANGVEVWLRSYVTLALYTGARRGELLGLDWGDIDINRKRLTFRRTKNGEPRAMPLHRKALAALKALGGKATPKVPVFRLVYADNDGRKVPSPQRLKTSTVDPAFKRIAKAAGLDEDFDGDFHFHDLRHSFASFLVQGGVPLNTVRELMGHKSIEMTVRYAHLAPDHRADAMAALDGLPGGGVGRGPLLPSRLTAT